MGKGILIPKAKRKLEKTVFCSRYQVKDKRVPGVSQFQTQGQEGEGESQKHSSFPHEGPADQGTRGYSLGARELGKLVSYHLGSNILDTQKASTTFLPPP